MTQLFLQAPRGKELESDLLEGSNLGLRARSQWALISRPSGSRKFKKSIFKFLQKNIVNSAIAPFGTF
jgi:hypothetical protein